MKKLDDFNELQNMIATTTRVEHDIVLNLFNLYYKSEFNTKAINIFRLILQYPDSNEKKVLERLKYNRVNKKELHMIYGHIKNLILESLSLDIHIDRPNDYNSSFRNKLIASKKILQSQILISRGLYQEAGSLIRESISKSSKYQHYSITHEALLLKTLLSTQKSGIQTFRNRVNQSKKAKNLRDTIEKIQEEYVNAMIENNNGTDTNIDVLNRALDISSELNRKNPSALGEYYTLLMKEKVATINHSFSKSETLLHEILLLIKSNSSIYCQAREHDTMLKLSVTLAHLKKMDAAENILNKLKTSIKKSTIEAYLTSKRLVFISFYKQENSKAIKQIEILKKSKYTLRKPYASSMFQYLQAAHSFFNKDHKLCCSIIIEELKLNYKSSNDFLFGKIMTLTAASYSLPNSENHLKKSAFLIAKKSLNRLNTSILNDRAIIILEVIKTIITKSGFNFKEVFSQKLKLLKSEPQVNQWQPFGFEIFPFEKWLEAQINGTNCDFRMI